MFNISINKNKKTDVKAVKVQAVRAGGGPAEEEAEDPSTTAEAEICHSDLLVYRSSTSCSRLLHGTRKNISKGAAPACQPLCLMPADHWCRRMVTDNQ